MRNSGIRHQASRLLLAAAFAAEGKGRPTAAKRFEVKNIDGSADVEVYIYDVIGADPFFGGVSAKQVIDEITAKVTGETANINININSPGGDVFEANAIFNFIARQKASKTVRVDGLAASAASLVAMVGDQITIAENGMMMIHNAWGIGLGDGAELRKTADVLDKINATIRDTYAKRTGKSADEVQAMMDAETWMDATEAVANGFATTVNQSVKAAALLVAKPAALAGKLRVKDAARLAAALAEEQPAEEPESPEEPEQPEQPKPEQQPDAKAECKRFVEAFGAVNGSKWFTEGVSFADAQAKHSAALATENKALKLRLEQAGKASGEAGPLSVDPAGDGDDKGKPNPYANRLPDGIGRFASSIKLPQKGGNN